MHLLTSENLAALLTLTALEIVLGIDNIVFIAILVGRLPEKTRAKARFVGLFLAMFIRIGLLFSISWVMSLTKPLFDLSWPLEHTFSGKDLVLLIGGLFLVAKATLEIHHKIEGAAEGDVHLPGDRDSPSQREGAGGTARVAPGSSSSEPATSAARDGGGGGGRGGVGIPAKQKAAAFFPTLIQILLLDIVFSLDSVITAVGMAKHIPIMVIAVVIAVGVMLIFSGHVSRIIERHPTLKMLALSFLILIGVMLTAEGLHQHINKGYIYVAMAFSLAVEGLNIWFRSRAARKHA